MKGLTEYESREILLKNKIPVTKGFLAENEDEAVNIARKIGYPVVMKVCSSDILHKTEAKGVVTLVDNDGDVRKNFNEIVKNVKKYKTEVKIKGILIEEMASGKQVIIGSKKDQQFGPVIMFGIGGIYVEILDDVSFRIIPIKKKDAIEMIKEIKGYNILEGVRGERPINFKALVEILLKISDLIWKNEKIEELDLNPIFINEKDAIVADARIIMSD
jgi:acetyl-CoA synthetase (ADP-forming)